MVSMPKSTLSERIEARDPAAIREVREAIVAAQGELVAVAVRLGMGGDRARRVAAAARLVRAAGLDEALAAAQQEPAPGGAPAVIRAPSAALRRRIVAIGDAGPLVVRVRGATAEVRRADGSALSDPERRRIAGLVAADDAEAFE